MKNTSIKLLKVFLSIGFLFSLIVSASNVVDAQTAKSPTVTTFSWSPSPKSNQPFGGPVTGTNFVSGTRVIFCTTGTSNCRNHPAANVSFSNPTRLNLTNIKLPAGSWQMYVQTPQGASPKSRAFTVASSVPTITVYSWSPSPKGNQPFAGLINGTDFVSGTRVYFCPTGTSDCRSHPTANISFSNPTRLNLTNIRLPAGSWQLYVQTTEGPSPKSRAFTVASSVPTITVYSWSPTPKGNQPFAGLINGTDFVSGTRVYFCATGTSNCRSHPTANISFSNPTRLNLTNIRLPAGSWQSYVQTPEGASPKSIAFTVASSVPTITVYSWSPSPKANQPFAGLINGTDFVSGTRVYFCATGTSNCRSHPAANISFSNPTRLNLTNIILPAGSWQLYVQTPEGASPKSRAFTVAQ